MPLYEYICENCGYEFEELVSDSDSDIKCKKCNSPVKRKVSSFFSVVTGSESLDVKIGKEAEKRWEMHHEHQEARRQGKTLEKFNLPQKKGVYSPVMALGDKDERSKRVEYSNALKEHRKEREKRGQAQFTEAGPF